MTVQGKEIVYFVWDDWTFENEDGSSVFEETWYVAVPKGYDGAEAMYFDSKNHLNDVQTSREAVAAGDVAYIARLK